MAGQTLSREYGVVVLGLDEFRRGLKQIDVKLTKELGQFHKSIGQEVVDAAEQRRRKLQGRYGSYAPRWGGRRGVTIKASSDQRRVAVTVRPGAAEFGLDGHKVFGRWYPRQRLESQVWPVWSGNQHTGGRAADGGVGYLVFPSLREELPRVTEKYLDGISDFARRTVVGIQ